jgi:hypothetical protein
MAPKFPSANLPSGWKGWVLSLLHIETLFIVGVLVIAIYLMWFSKDREGDLERMGFAANWESLKKPGFVRIPKEYIKKKDPKKKKDIYINEERCRKIFQDIFKVEFKSVRPGWLKNPATGHNLELDGFNPDIKTRLGYGLAFERDGGQHGRYIPHFHRSGPEEFLYQVKKDEWKDLRCKEKGILLIRIPEFVAPSDLERYIKTKLRKEGFDVGKVQPGVYLLEGLYS